MDFESAAAGLQGWRTHYGRARPSRVTAEPTRGRGALSVVTQSGYPAVSTDRVRGSPRAGGSRCGSARPVAAHHPPYAR